MQKLWMSAAIFAVAPAMGGCTSARFVVDGQTAHMNGVINGSTPGRVERLLEANPDLETLVLDDVPGSSNDEANVRAARLIRDAGLATHVPADGVIASGGVDFFCAGVRRTFDSGAQFGVHSWAGGGIVPTELPEDAPEHSLYLDFYAEMGIPADFYWFTLEAAPAEGIHWMTEEELSNYGLVTE